jgi:DNA-binding LacI/PurR family transcriptional regulator
VKVIGFDNVDEGAFTVPSLSSIDPDHETMARTAVKLLVRRIKGGVPGESRQEFVSKFSVVERESTRG